MASNLSVSLQPEPVRTVLGTAIAAAAGAYINVGTPLAQPARLILFQNGTDGDVMVSFDGGITDHLPVFLGSFVLFDVTTNRTDTGGSYNINKGTQFSVRTLGGTFTTPTTKAFFITSIYAK